MGLKTIAALREELEKKAKALEAFELAAKTFVETHAKIQESHDNVQKAYENVEKLRTANHGKVMALDTLGIKEFEDYKKSLVQVYSHWGPERPLPLKPLRDVVMKQQAAVNEAVKARVEKLAAAFPKEIKKGMVFKFEPTGVLWEITSEATESKNINLKGDAKIWYDYLADNGTKNSVNVETLKKSCKFIKT